MARAYWLIKSEPDKYPWSKLLEDGFTRWDGIRNYQARNNLRLMKIGDLAFYYHSNIGKHIVGIARVKQAAYPDPTSTEDWSAVDVEPVIALARPVALDDIRAHPSLSEMALLKQGRLSVAPVTSTEFKIILNLGKTKLPSS